MPTKEIKVVKKRNQPTLVRTAPVREARRGAAVESFQIPENTVDKGRSRARAGRDTSQGRGQGRVKAGEARPTAPAKNAGRRS